MHEEYSPALLRKLAAEFRARPIGRHSAALHRLLLLMRGAPDKDRFALLCTNPFSEWMLIELPLERDAPPTFYENVRFSTLAEAEWDVFKRRIALRFSYDLTEDQE